jgi:oxaloacetate decarboxylase alpha subunit
MVPNEVKDVVRGMYGKTTVPIKKAIVKKIIGDEKQIKGRPADTLKPELKEAKKEAAEYIEQEEDILTYAMFPKPAIKFFEYRKAEKYKTDSTLLDKENEVYPV